MNVLLLVVDSLRSVSLDRDDGPRTPFLSRFGRESVVFRRAYATECWTLPTHCSMFTGLLPSEHGAHFQNLRYGRTQPTAAEILAASGFATEVITRNFVFDGTIPGITRGFQHNTTVLAEKGYLNPWTLLLAMTKPRFRRTVRATGFFHPQQRESRRFLSTFARALMPADDLALAEVAERLRGFRRQPKPFFLFCNLYDVHAPYPPTPTSILRPFWKPSGLAENVMFPYFMTRLGAHAYLKRGFRLRPSSRRMLLGRYHDAIALMDRKLERFFAAAQADGLLDDTVVILTSDHGEAFGEHDLYLHDASVYDTHLHVPLWIRHPALLPEVVEDVVSTRDLFDLLVRAPERSTGGTLLDPGYRAARPIALAEHFHYTHVPDMDPRYRRNLRAAIIGRRKFVASPDGICEYDLERDPGEEDPRPSNLREFRLACARAGAAGAAADDAADRLPVAAA
jgi:arylsulfatase A-like enzyme